MQAELAGIRPRDGCSASMSARRLRPHGPPVDTLVPRGFSLSVTEPSGRSNTHGADDGRTGWKRHAHRSGSNTAVCGLRPALGWGGDLFEDGMDICRRCAVALGACKTCKGSARVSELTHDDGRRRTYETAECPSCHGDGLSEAGRVVAKARPFADTPSSADNETLSDVANDSDDRKTACEAVRILAFGRQDRDALIEAVGDYWDHLESIGG